MGLFLPLPKETTLNDDQAVVDSSRKILTYHQDRLLKMLRISQVNLRIIRPRQTVHPFEHVLLIFPCFFDSPLRIVLDRSAVLGNQREATANGESPTEAVAFFFLFFYFTLWCVRLTCFGLIASFLNPKPCEIARLATKFTCNQALFWV